MEDLIRAVSRLTRLLSAVPQRPPPGHVERLVRRFEQARCLWSGQMLKDRELREWEALRRERESRARR